MTIKYETEIGISLTKCPHYPTVYVAGPICHGCIYRHGTNEIEGWVECGKEPEPQAFEYSMSCGVEREV